MYRESLLIANGGRTMTLNNGLIKTAQNVGAIDYISSDDNPIYYGEIEVIHDDCPFLSISDKLEKNLDLHILYGRSEDSFQTVRFHLNQILGHSNIKNVLNDALNSKSIKDARVIVNGGTTFEVRCQDAPLNNLTKITDLPFGEIASYVAHPDRETYKLFSPTIGDINGKERLLEYEEKLGEYGTANLLEFRKMQRNDYAINNFLNQHGKTPDVWLKSDELNIIKMAMANGYFESPKRVGLDELASKLNISRGTLSDKLRLINRQVLDRFVNQMNQPFTP